MPASMLLDLDPDKLFEQYTIQEIEETQKKLQYEIERKREELRTMVGERYRDLIEAADTISEMKVLSEDVIKDVDKMSAATVILQQKLVTGFKLEPLNDKSFRCKNENQLNRVAAQIKLLVDIAEHIWTAIDSKDFTHATLLFLLARHVKTCLEMDQSVKTSSSFPVLVHQWSSMAHFKDTILNSSEQVLQAQHLTAEDACGCLLSIALLQGFSPSQLLDRYLALRSAALQHVLSFNQHSPDSSSVKQRLYESHSLIVNSLLALCHCFVENQDASEALLWKNVRRITENPTINIQDLDVPKHFLPLIVLDFRPHLTCELKSVPESELESAVSKWLTWVNQYVSDKGNDLLNLLCSLRSLQGLRDSVQALPLVTQKLLFKPMNLWTDLYRPLIISRAKQLMTVHWESAISGVEQALESSLHEGRQSEVDLRWHIWKESPNDLTLKSQSSECYNSRGLWLKSKGISPRVSELCGILETKLVTLVTDLATLCPEREVDPIVLADTQVLRQHQQTVCAEAVNRLVKFVRKALSEREHNETTAILLAKFLQAMPELCPSLHRCLSSTDSKTISWQDMCSTLHSEVLSVYKVWLQLVQGRLTGGIKDKLRQPSSLTELLRTTPQWELVVIEEGGEGEELVKSELRVPSSPSFSLQAVLNDITAVASHAAVPKQVTEQLTESLLPEILSCYKPDPSLSVTQSQYLQQLLDVKYITQLLIAPHKKALLGDTQEIVTEIENRIDPFDLNVFLPYINDNVKRSIQRTQALLGAITSSHNVSTVLSSKNEEASVLAMSNTAASTWFPLLHVTAPHSTLNPTTKPKGIKKSVSTPILESSNEAPSRQQSAASSFFGVMATDWFG